MRSGKSGVLISFGTILLSFGITILIIELLAARYGTRHDIAGILMVVCFVGGAVLTGAGVFMNRSSDKRT